MNKEEFEKIDKVIRRERLYANVGLMRADVMARFGISRHRLNYLLTRYADGMSFPQYINAIRIEEAYDLITYHPEMSIAEVAAEVGLTAPNLRGLFKRRYGMTPSKYRTHLE
jgi:AraC-like DNA-binding protein